MTKAKKGDIVVVQRATSYHTVKGRKVDYNTFIFARAEKVSREGLVRAYRTVQGVTCLSDSYTMIYVLPAHQQAAHALYDAGDAGFVSLDQVKDALTQNMENAI